MSISPIGSHGSPRTISVLPTLMFPNNQHSPQSSETPSKYLWNKQKANPTLTSSVKPEMFSPSSEILWHLSPPPLTPMALVAHCLVVWLTVHILSPQLDCECLQAGDHSFCATITLRVPSTWHEHSNNLFKELIKMLAFLFLSVAVLVVTGGSYHSLMFGNATETALYKLG